MWEVRETCQLLESARSSDSSTVVWCHYCSPAAAPSRSLAACARSLINGRQTHSPSKSMDSYKRRSGGHGIGTRVDEMDLSTAGRQGEVVRGVHFPVRCCVVVSVEEDCGRLRGGSTVEESKGGLGRWPVGAEARGVRSRSKRGRQPEERATEQEGHEDEQDGTGQAKERSRSRGAR